MVTEDQVRASLEKVMDPELNRSIIDLDMLDSISVHGDKVDVVIKLTVAHCPARARLQEDAEAAVRSVPGVKDVSVTLSTMTAEERDALGRRLRGAPQRRHSGLTLPESNVRVLIIASGKGGVGKSTVTANLAAAMQASGHQVGVLDADIYGFSIPRMLGLSGPPTVLGEGLILPMDAQGMRVMSMGSFVDENTPVIWRGPMLAKMLDQFLEDVAWGDLEYLLVDSPPGTGDVALSLSQKLPRARILLVTTPQQTAARVAGRVAQMARRTGQKLIGLVENMSYYECAECGHRSPLFGQSAAEELAAELEVPMLARLPLTDRLAEHADAGQPVVWAEPMNATSRIYRDLADAVTASSIWVA